ncbi:MAG: alpha/beta fold hydrolase [Chitinophagaceae bacterium]|nr:alpha/beta fold hydrolase [Rubrivivax sp.]
MNALSSTPATALADHWWDEAGHTRLREFLRNMGSTPADVVHSDGLVKLLHYLPLQPDVFRLPVLMVPSIINRPYILDLVPGQSLVQHLLHDGFDVYLVDWGRPRAEHSGLGLSDYVVELLPGCIEALLSDCGERRLSVIGYCLGGLMACLYAARFPRGPLKNLVALAAPVDATGLDLLQAWCGRSRLDLDRAVDEFGNVPAEQVTLSMQMLRPMQRLVSEASLLGAADSEDLVAAHLRFAHWVADQVPIAGQTFRDLVEHFLRNNGLVAGAMKIGGRAVSLADIRAALLHARAEHDHIVTPASAAPLVPLAGSRDKRDLVVKGGHVSLVAGRNAQTRLWPELSAWLGQRSTGT